MGESSFYVLRFDADVVEAALSAGGTANPDGIDDAFDLLNEISESVKTAVWVGDCFIYNNASWRLNYCVGGEVGACRGGRGGQGMLGPNQLGCSSFHFCIL